MCEEDIDMLKDVLRENRLDRLLDNAFHASLYSDVYSTSTGYSDLVKNEKDKSTITISVPGLSKEDIDLEIKEEGLLLLNFNKKSDFFSYKYKSWTIDDDIDVPNVTAECKDGILTVTLPKVKRIPSTRKIQIV